MVNLLNDNTYLWVCATVIVSSFGLIEQGVHHIRIYSTRKAFLECAVAQLV